MSLPWTNRQRRGLAMMRAYLTHHASKMNVPHRRAQTWFFLLEWARLGGSKRDPIPGVQGERK